MKKLIAILSLVLIAGTISAFAIENPKTPKSRKVFEQKFVGAENVKWTNISSEYEKVWFTMAGSSAEAYFNSNGELLGTARNIFFSQLPLSVIQRVNNRFAGSVVIEVNEITNVDGTSYKVVVEQKDRKYVIKLSSLGDITDLSKQKIRK